MAVIELGDGLAALVDDEDFPALSARKWFAHHASGRTYVASRSTESGRRSLTYLHREIMGSAGRKVRFANGNPLDCRRENLVASEAFRERRTIDVGAEAEAMVCAALIRAGHDVFTPFSGHSAADLISVKGASRPIRWQVKHRKASGDGRSVSLSLSSVRTSREGARRVPTDLTRIDAFAIFCPETGEIYYVPVALIPPGAGTFNINISAMFPRTGIRRSVDFRDPDAVLVTFRDTFGEKDV